ncbi:MAG: spore coat associated protein CotJA [Clostridia bacterium]|nr:spore coat associated protein CotJA [Clostridia bacterium]
MYGQSYVPVQVMENTYMPCSGLHKGTIFPELVSEYMPGQSMAEIQYIMDTNAIKEGCNG